MLPVDALSALPHDVSELHVWCHFSKRSTPNHSLAWALLEVSTILFDEDLKEPWAKACLSMHSYTSYESQSGYHSDFLKAAMEDTYPKEIALLLKRKGISPVPEESQIIDGQHLSLLKDSQLSLSQLCKICEEDNAHEAVLDVLIQHVKTESQTKPLKECAWELLVYGVALLELFCQANFTGPELNPRERELLHAVEDQAMHRKMVQHLECDGLYPFNSVDLPHVLLLARLVLSFVASSTNLTWKSGIVFSREGMISLPTIAVSDPKFAFLSDFADAASSLCSAKWWSSRAAVIHTRLLQGQSYEQVPTLWHEVMECFTPTLEKFCTIDSSEYYSQELCKFNFGTCPLLPGSWESSVCNEKESRKLSSMALIEWGLACHHFNYGDKVRIVPPSLLCTYPCHSNNKHICVIG